MSTKLKSKSVILIIVVAILLLSLCACNDPANQTKTVSITLPTNYGAPINLGDFPVVEENISYNYHYYEILPNQYDKLIEMLENHKCYRGTISFQREEMLPSIYDVPAFKVDDECLWFSHDGYVWIGRLYARKFFYIAPITQRAVLGDGFSCRISDFFFTKKNDSLIAEKEYSTYLSWSNIKQLYSDYQIDEDSHSITVDCSIKPDEGVDICLSKRGLTTLHYNLTNKTIRILNEYVEK